MSDFKKKVLLHFMAEMSSDELTVLVFQCLTDLESQVSMSKSIEMIKALQSHPNTAPSMVALKSEQIAIVAMEYFKGRVLAMNTVQ